MADRSPLSDLAESLSRLAALTKSVDDEISELELLLDGSEPGFEHWHETPIIRQARGQSARGAQFGYAKIRDEWGFWLRRGEFTKAENGKWKPVSSSKEWEFLPLSSGSRYERASAVGHLDQFVRDFRDRAESLWEMMRDARMGHA